MSSATNQPGPKGPANKNKKAAAVPDNKKELKILGLHGYTQSGPLFDSKTRALAKQLAKALGPGPLNLAPRMIFPTGPHRLRPQDIPGFEPPAEGDAEGGEEESDNWGWWRKDEAGGAYAGFAAGMRTVAAAIRDAGEGGIGGVVGFSQGACLAALVAAVLETPYRTPPAGIPSPEPTGANSSAEYDWSWVEELRAANGHRPLKFCVIYSGFWAPVEGLQWLYGGQEEEKKIQTPTLHFIGSLDSVVEESRSQALVERFRDPVVFVHMGGHHVPVARDRVMPLVGFLKEVMEKELEKEKEQEMGQGQESEKL